MKKSEAIKQINPLFLKGICHRGLHNKEFTENGLNAFKNAIENNMAFELDVHLTKDNEIVVFHDSDTKRITNKEGIIEELTLKEIKENYKLGDGSTIPTLKEVFELNNERVPIVVELKVYKGNYKELGKQVKEVLKIIKDEKNIVLIAFDPRVLFLFNKEGFIRQLLVGKKTDYTYIFRHFFEGIDVEHIMLQEKRIQRYSKNHFVNTWTIENEEQLKKARPYIDTATFQYMDLDVIKESFK